MKLKMKITLKNRDIYNYKFIGNSNAINRIKNLIKKVSPTSSRVMIYGDSGTGKDIVAREIHRRSKYKDGPFITINAALMEPENIENDFFGSVDNGSIKLDILRLQQMEQSLLMRLEKCPFRLRQKY